MHWLKKYSKDTSFKTMAFVLLFATILWDFIITAIGHELFYWTTVGGWGIFFFIALPIAYLKRNSP